MVVVATELCEVAGRSKAEQKGWSLRGSVRSEVWTR